MASSSFPPQRSPLAGIRVVELAGLAPVPYAGLLLAQFGAHVLRIDRPHPSAHGSTSISNINNSDSSTSSAPPAPPTPDLLAQHKTSIALDLKRPSSRALLLDLLRDADVLLEPFRPGVLESLGLAPATLRAANPRLVVARLTGFRRHGKYAAMAGHDINYLAVAGVLGMLGAWTQDGSSGGGRAVNKPTPPANLLADFAGGGLMCALGVVLALFARDRPNGTGTGEGQVVECSMVDGVSSLAGMMRGARKTPVWGRARGENLLDGGAPWYGVYETKDGGWVAVGALEPQFFRALLQGLGVEGEEEARGLWAMREDRERWAEMRGVLERRFRGRTRKEWERVFDGTDACVTPVLGMEELEEEGYEVGNPVTLSATPALRDEGKGWDLHLLAAGEGGEKTLEEWKGWRRGKHYDVKDGALVKLESSKL